MTQMATAAAKVAKTWTAEMMEGHSTTVVAAMMSDNDRGIGQSEGKGNHHISQVPLLESFHLPGQLSQISLQTCISFSVTGVVQ